MRNLCLLKDGNDDAFVTEALILAGSSGISYKQHMVQAARTAWGAEMGTLGWWLPAVLCLQSFVPYGCS